MTAGQISPFALDAYKYGFRRDVHQLVVWGHKDASDRINKDSMEESITGFIVKAIKSRLSNPTTPDKFTRYFVEGEVKSEVEGRVGKQRRILDIVFESNHTKPRPTYVFEAKRLKQNAYPIGRYVGEEGLLCFVRGIYAAHYSEAAMLGYMQSGTVDYWTQELKRRFNCDKDKEMRVLQSLKKFEVNGCPTILVSEHERVENSPITLCHLLVDCS